MRVPKDTDGDLLPDWWEADNGLDAQMAGEADKDEDERPMVSGPPAPGIKGDGLSAYEEYRGFLVMGDHIRTDPRVKDLFVYREDRVDVPDFEKIKLGFIVNTGLNAHEIQPNPGVERGPNAGRLINFNATNSGAGPMETPGHRAQSALGVIFDNAGTNVPSSRLGMTIPVVGVPNQVTSIIIYVNHILNLGGFVSTNTMFRLETFKYVVGHELGHGVHICHSACVSQSCPDGAMVAPPPPRVICGGGRGPLGGIR
ncbi:MAG: hypothetical protein D6723_08365, partial [Acidobacteria bacterium]